ncbi:MAG: DUF2975 domain-containing protein [Oscillospiraceae bacterium]|nr:DUF2975 domain-containing protein [Oscillospiraceae bacterium]
MKNLNKVVKIVAKVFEIAHWVCACIMVVMAICSSQVAERLSLFFNMSNPERIGEASVYGFEVDLVNSAGGVNKTSLLLFAIGAVIIYALVAMIFRNIYLIIKRSESETPFNKDNIRMTREIGIFSIAIPVIGLIMSTILRLVVGVDAVETSVNLSGVIIGIMVLCLTQFFAYGAQLEKDVDGLL